MNFDSQLFLRTVRLVVLGVLCAGIAGCGSKTESPAAKADDQPADESAIAVRTEAAEMRIIAATIDGLGRCETLPQRGALLTPAIEGQVQRIAVTPGETVKQRQAIVQFDDRIAKANLAEKTASRDGLQASLRLLEAPPRPEELKSQQSAVDQAKVVCDKSQAAVNRLRPLLAKGEISAAQMSDAETAAKQAMLQCDAAQAQLQAMQLGPRAEAVAEARARIKTADALIDSAQSQLDLLTIHSPIDGILNSLSCQLGQTISAGTAIGEVVDARQLQVTVWLPSRTANRISTGQTARIRAAGVLADRVAGPTPSTTESPASPYDAKGSSESTQQPVTDVEGKVTFVGHVVDSQTGNVPVQITIDNSDHQFAVGQTVSASITVDESKAVLAVPIAALFDIGEGNILNVVRDGKSVHVTPVLGTRDKQWVQLLATDLKPPLEAGDRVIVEGGYNLPDGTEVQVATEEALAARTKPLRESQHDEAPGDKKDALPAVTPALPGATP